MMMMVVVVVHNSLRRLHGMTTWFLLFILLCPFLMRAWAGWSGRTQQVEGPCYLAPTSHFFVWFLWLGALRNINHFAECVGCVLSRYQQNLNVFWSPSLLGFCLIWLINHTQSVLGAFEGPILVGPPCKSQGKTESIKHHEWNRFIMSGWWQREWQRTWCWMGGEWWRRQERGRVM